MSLDLQTIREMVALRRKSFGFLAFLVLLALSGQIYLSSWQRPELERVQKEWFAKRDALAKGETLADATKYRNGVRDLDEFKKRLIPKKEFAAFLSRLHQTAGRNSLSLGSITYKPSPVKGEEQILSYGVAFSVKGKYGNIKSFLADLANYPEMITVDSVSLSSDSDVEEKVNLNIQTTMYLLTEGA